MQKLKISDIQLGVLLFMANFTSRPTGELSLRKAFLAVDQLADGEIDEKELKAALGEYLGMTAKQAEQGAREML
jgi:Ca2+-binding EF-hand superfamily protein